MYVLDCGGYVNNSKGSRHPESPELRSPSHSSMIVPGCKSSKITSEENCNVNKNPLCHVSLYLYIILF